MADPLLDVLKNSVPEDKQHYLNKIEWQEYLDHLRTLPQGSIHREKQYLEASHGSIQSTLISLTQTSYKQFIDSSKSISQFSEKFDAFKNQTNEFSEAANTTTIDTTISTASSSSSSSAVEQKSNDPVILLKNLDKVQDILELPSLAMACVRNGYYSEALDLASHARRLKLRYTNIKIINQVQQEIDQVIRKMTAQLFKLLRQQSKLPTLIKVVSYLRRVHPFYNAPDATRQLQHLFLASRLNFIKSQLQTLTPLKAQSPDKYLKKYIEVYREHVYATVTGFKSIFPSSTENDEEKECGERLTAEFLRATVDQLQNTIEDISPLVKDQQTRNSLWLQIVYCSQSLGRVGADFWPTVQSRSNAISNEEWQEAIAKQKDISKRLGHM